MAYRDTVAMKGLRWADYDAGTMQTVDGNSVGQTIRTVDKKITPAGQNASNQTIYGYYQLRA